MLRHTRIWQANENLLVDWPLYGQDILQVSLRQAVSFDVTCWAGQLLNFTVQTPSRKLGLRELDTDINNGVLSVIVCNFASLETRRRQCKLCQV